MSDKFCLTTSFPPVFVFFQTTNMPEKFLQEAGTSKYRIDQREILPLIHKREENFRAVCKRFWLWRFMEGETTE